MLGFLELPSSGEWLILLFVGLLVFGRRLPEVARSMGQSIAEFKRGLSETIQERSVMPPSASPQAPAVPPAPAAPALPAEKPAIDTHDPAA